MKFLQVISFIIFTSVLSFKTSAAVWATKAQWNQAYEVKYQEWVSKNVPMDIFLNSENPYYGISTDCADLVYALRIIFSFENGLPFTAVDSSLTKGSRLVYITEKTAKFNGYTSGTKRLKAFIDYVSNINGTQSLARFDTYPVALKGIKTGDIYLAEWQSQEGYEVNHSYVIREVSPFGYFEFFYSSTPSLVRKLIQLSGMPSMPITGEPWGFRRFKWPQHYAGSAKMADYSKEQYKYALEHKSDFFEFLQKLIQTELEPVDSIFKRRLSNICSQLMSRSEVVLEAKKYFLALNGRCATKKEFNLYSTSMRDRTTLTFTKELISLWRKYVYEGGYQDSSYSIQLSLDYLASMDNSESARAQLTKFCPLEIEGLPRMGLREFFEASEKGIISAHPNSSVLARWGQEQGSNCESYY